MVAETGPWGRVLPTIHVSVNRDVDGPPLGQQHSPGNCSDFKHFIGRLVNTQDAKCAQLLVLEHLETLAFLVL